MPVESMDNIKAVVLELCTEDDYGSWELWGDISAGVAADQEDELQKRFLDVVSELVSGGQLIAKTHSSEGNIAPTGFDRVKLAREINSASDPDPDSSFWFGTK